MLITTTEDPSALQRLAGSGDDHGINLSNAMKLKSERWSKTLIICENFIGDDQVYLMLGDNIFYGQGCRPILVKTAARGELKITNVNQPYRERGDLWVRELGYVFFAGNRRTRKPTLNPALR